MTGSSKTALSYLSEKPRAVGLLMEQISSARSAGSEHATFRAPRLQTRAVAHLAKRPSVSEGDILSVSDISECAYHLRGSGPELLTPAESDRLLRIARVAAETERVFGSPARSRQWLTAVGPPWARGLSTSWALIWAHPRSKRSIDFRASAEARQRT